MNLRFWLLLMLVFLISCKNTDDNLLLLDPDKPGTEPEIFAEGILSTESAVEFSICFSPGADEIFISRRETGKPNQIFHTKLINGSWTKPVSFKFSYNCFEFEPYVSLDNRYLFYGSKRPLPGTDTLNWFPDIWICENSDTGWSEPYHYRTGMMFLSMTKSGKIYFTGFPDEMDAQHVSYQDSLYGTFIKMDNSINYLPFAGHPYIDTDEQFLIYDSQTATENKDLYISFRNHSGKWGKGKKLGPEINTDADECCAMISPGGEYLFFTREQDIYWVNSKILDNYKDQISE